LCKAENRRLMEVCNTSKMRKMQPCVSQACNYVIYSLSLHRFFPEHGPVVRYPAILAWA